MSLTNKKNVKRPKVRIGIVTSGKVDGPSIAPLRRNAKKHSAVPRLSVVPPSVPISLSMTVTTPVSVSVSTLVSTNPVQKLHVQAALPSLSDDWLDLNAPKNIGSVVGREGQIKRLDEWLQEFVDNPNPAKPMALLHGRPGTGKTSVSHLLLAKYGYQVVEINASDTRSYEGVTKVLDRVCLRRSITGKAALLLDEIDGAYESDTGKSSITAIKDFLVTYKADKNKSPIIATCNVTHKANIKQLFPYALVVTFPKLYDNHLSQIAHQVAQRHTIRVNQERVKEIVQRADGDARQVIQSLRLLSLSSGATCAKDEGDNIFEITKQLLRGRRPVVHSDVFTDCGGYGTGLLFQNYLSAVAPTRQKPVGIQNMEQVSLLADAFADSDVLTEVEDNINAEMVITGATVFSRSVTTRDTTFSKCNNQYFNRPLYRYDCWDDVFEQKGKKSDE